MAKADAEVKSSNSGQGQTNILAAVGLVGVSTAIYARIGSHFLRGDDLISTLSSLLVDAAIAGVVSTLAGVVVSTNFVRPPWFTVRQREKLDEENVAPYWPCKVDPKTDLGYAYEDVEFTSTVDNVRLSGWFVPAVDVKEAHIQASPRTPVVILVHGGGRDRRAHLAHVQLFHQAGVDCFLFDLRQHGASEVTDGKLRYGETEHRDVEGAVEYLYAKGRRNIILVGTSMGASSCIFAAARDTHGVIRGMMAENPVANPGWLAAPVLPKFLRRIMPNACVSYSFLLLRLLAFGTKLAILHRTGWFIRVLQGKDADALSVAHRVRCPTVVTHSWSDQIVPIQQGFAIYNALTCSEKSFWEVTDSLHCMLFYDHQEEYVRRASALLESARQYSLSRPPCMQ